MKSPRSLWVAEGCPFPPMVGSPKWVVSHGFVSIQGGFCRIVGLGVHLGSLETRNTGTLQKLLRDFVAGQKFGNELTHCK